MSAQSCLTAAPVRLTAAIVVVFFIQAGPAAGVTPTPISPQCGSIVGPGGDYVLQGDVGPCTTTGGQPALTLVGPVTVDMAGFALPCHTAPLDEYESIAITASGRAARLENGRIENCQTGIALQGDGRHQVEGVGIDYIVRAADVSTDRNVLRGNRIERAPDSLDEDVGFRVAGDRNLIAENLIAGAPRGGILVTGRRNRVVRNRTIYGTIAASGQNNLIRENVFDQCTQMDHCLTIGGRRNRVVRNSGEGGIYISGDEHRVIENRCSYYEPIEGPWALYAIGNGHVLRRNHANGRFELRGSRIEASGNVVESRYGFVIAGERHVLTKNVAMFDGGPDNYRGPRVGFLIDGAHHRLRANSAYDYWESGFLVASGSHSSVLSNNQAFGNNLGSSASDFDMRDDNVDCGTNRWIDNRFGTRNLPCIGATEELPPGDLTRSRR